MVIYETHILTFAGLQTKEKPAGYALFYVLRNVYLKLDLVELAVEAPQFQMDKNGVPS